MSSSASHPATDAAVPPRLELPEVLGWLADELNTVAQSATTLQGVVADLTHKKDDVETLTKLQDLDRLTQKADVLSRFMTVLSGSVMEQPVEAVDQLLNTLVLGELSQGLLKCAAQASSGPEEEKPEEGWVDFF